VVDGLAKELALVVTEALA